MPITPPDTLERTASTTADWLPGFDLLSLLGAGSFGKVFKAVQLKFERVVAVKVISIDDESHSTIAARFEKEALTHGKLHHPNIVQVYDRGRHGERLYIAMELLDGEDLGQRIRRDGPLPERIVWSIARQTASALAHAHQQGVVHRDIKPANLFLVAAPSGLGLDRDVPLVKVTDFGLALTKQAATETQSRLTADGIVLGTPIYMAPEQYRHSPDLDHRADIYSLGATIAHMLNGHPPFDGPTVWDVMLHKLERGPQLAATISGDSRDLITAMMANDPADRPPTYEDLIARIDRMTTQCPAETAIPARRMPMRALAGCGLALLLATTALLQPLLRPVVRATDDAAFTTTGKHLSLFDGTTMLGWLPPASGGAWQLDADEEGDAILSGTGFLRRAFPDYAHYRMTVGLDVHQAAFAELHFALPDQSAESVERLVVRVSKVDGAVLGKRRGDRGNFVPISKAVPFPPASWFEGRRPYLELKVERAGNVWSATFNGQLLGRERDDGLRKSADLRCGAENGSSRINSVIITELIPN